MSFQILGQWYDNKANYEEILAWNDPKLFSNHCVLSLLDALEKAVSLCAVSIHLVFNDYTLSWNLVSRTEPFFSVPCIYDTCHEVYNPITIVNNLSKFSHLVWEGTEDLNMRNMMRYLSSGAWVPFESQASRLPEKKDSHRYKNNQIKTSRHATWGSQKDNTCTLPSATFLAPIGIGSKVYCFQALIGWHDSRQRIQPIRAQ
jgi:hypothetical protein